MVMDLYFTCAKYGIIRFFVPNCSMVLGSYAHFMWEAEQEEDEKFEGINRKVDAPAAELIAAF